MDLFGNNKMQKIYNIQYCSKIYNEQKKKVEKEKYLEELLFADYVEKIKNNNSRYDYCENQIRQAQNELHSKGRKPNLRNLEKLLAEDFFSGELIEIKDIIAVGYETYCWNIVFNYLGKKYTLQIPMVDNITIKNITYANWGMFTLFEHEGSCTLKSVTHGYMIEDVSQYLKELSGE